MTGVPDRCPNHLKCAHPAKLKLTWRGACSACGRQITDPPPARRLRGRSARNLVTIQYNGAPE